MPIPKQIRISKTMIEKITRLDIQYFRIPNGTHSAKFVQVRSFGYRLFYEWADETG